MAGAKFGLLTAAALLLTVSASDQEANEFFSQGRVREKDASYRRAASRYMDGHFMAESSVLRGNLLIAAARAYRKAKLYGEEFDCLERLIREHLNEINFSQVVDRQYQIGDLFFAGHRDLVVSWIPFIREKDRTVEIYEAVLKNAPCHKNAAETRLRLSRIYIDDQKTDDAVRHLREIPKLHPGSPSAKYAMLELCSLLYQMAERGDGDGSYSRQTIEACDNYLKAFPGTPEVPWVNKTRQKALNGIASRFHAVGRYYYRSGKPELAEKYLAEVVRNYSNTSSAADAENLLAKIDEEFEVPPGQKRRYRPFKEKIHREPIPLEDSPILITPENSGRRWLLPIRDLKKSPSVTASTMTPEEFEKFQQDSELINEQKKQIEQRKNQELQVKKEVAKPLVFPWRQKKKVPGEKPNDAEQTRSDQDESKTAEGDEP
ncbi:MAG: outer membrane protein assembly factor BamD [Lentisphaeria bacterium]|nr:outer membrane protein assembly factor BamD [Lentisphaeria bacterium]